FMCRVTRMSYASTSPSRTRSTSSESSGSTTGTARVLSPGTDSTAGARAASVARARTLPSTVTVVPSIAILRYHLANHLLLLLRQYRTHLTHCRMIDLPDPIQQHLHLVTAFLRHGLALRARHIGLLPLP